MYCPGSVLGQEARDVRLKALILCLACLDLLDHTTKWLTQAVADLTTPPPSGPDNPDSSSTAGTSSNESLNSPEPLSPGMVLSQGFLNLLLWDPENEEFPEVREQGHCLGVSSEASHQGSSLLHACSCLLPRPC